jgi:hypothetical protein
MPARTYSTHVYLTCPCPECEGREVHIALRKCRSLSWLPSQPASRVVHQLVSGRDNGSSEGQPKAPTVGRHPAGARRQ